MSLSNTNRYRREDNTPPCALHLDANDLLSALDEGIDGLDPLEAKIHVDECASCRAIASVRARSRAAWATAFRAPPMLSIAESVDLAKLRREWEQGRAASSSEKREKKTAKTAEVGRTDRELARTEPLRSQARSRQPRRPFHQRTFLSPQTRALVIAAVTPLCVAALVVAVVRRTSSHPEEMATESAAHSAEPRLASESKAPPTAVVASAPPPGERDRDRDRDPDAPKPAARSMVVPSGSKLLLGFAAPAADAPSPQASPSRTPTAPPTSGSAELIGPATASATDSTLTLQRGTAKLVGLRHVAVVLPGAKIDPNGSTCTIRVDERGVARVSVDSGRAIVTGRVSVTVEAGGSMELDPDGSLHVAPPTSAASPAPISSLGPLPSSSNAPAPEPPALAPISDEERVRRAALAGAAPQLVSNPDDAISAARTRLRTGDAASARAELEQLAQSTDARVARRASFTLAELDLAAGGDRPRARRRLEDLVTCPEPALGADAATLLARSFNAPRERAAVWQRFLSTHPPRPYYERALLDRAEALLDAGDVSEAKVILEDVRHSFSLTDSQRRQLDRLLVKSRDIR